MSTFNDKKLSLKPLLALTEMQETFIKTPVSTNRDMPGNRDIQKVVRGQT